METVEKISSNIQNPISQMAEAASDLVEPKPQGIFSQFRNNKIVSGSKDFLESNSLVAKIVFILLVLILFIYLLRIMIIILHNLFGPVKNPILIDGIINGKKSIGSFVFNSKIPSDKTSVFNIHNTSIKKATDKIIGA